MFPQGDAHVLSSAPGMRAAPDMSLFARPIDAAADRLRARWRRSRSRARSSAASSAATSVRSIRCSPHCRAVIHLSAAGPRGDDRMARNAAEHRRAGVGQRAGGRRERPGASVGTDVRRDDPPIPRDAPARPDRLARGIARSGRRTGAGRAARRADASRGRSNGWRDSSALSRSVLAERFTEMVGQPPMQYLALWRMQLASRLLVEGGQVAAVAGPSATNRKRRSAARSRSWWARRRRRGGEARSGAK